MSSFPVFGSSLLNTPPQGTVSADKAAEDLIQSPQRLQKPDSFEHSQGGVVPEDKRRSSLLIPILTTIVGAGGLFVAGRRGAFGKTLKRWCGGLPSVDKVNKNIDAKIQEYVGKEGAKVNNVVKETTPEGVNLVTFELENGTSRVFTRTDGKNSIKFESTFPDGKAEVIFFSKDDGVPKLRTLLTLDGEGNVIKYNSFKGADILNEAFVDADGIYKSFERTTKARTVRSFWPGKSFFKKKNKVDVSSTVHINDNVDMPHTVKTKTSFVDGNKASVTHFDNTKGSTKYAYEDNKMYAKKETDLDGNSKYYEAVYENNSDGKAVLKGFSAVED